MPKVKTRPHSLVSKYIIMTLLVSILCSVDVWALRIESPREGDAVYAGSTMTVIVKPDPGEDWASVAFGFDVMNYNPLTQTYSITVPVPIEYMGSYDNLVITAVDKNGNSVRLKGKVLVRLPGHIVLNSLKVDNYKPLYKRLSSVMFH
jgi:hypothetical protein